MLYNFVEIVSCSESSDIIQALTVNARMLTKFCDKFYSVVSNKSKPLDTQLRETLLNLLLEIFDYVVKQGYLPDQP